MGQDHVGGFAARIIYDEIHFSERKWAEFGGSAVYEFWTEMQTEP